MLGFKLTVSGIPRTNIQIANCFVNTYENALSISATVSLKDHDIGLTHLSKEPVRNANEVISVRHHRTDGEVIPVSGSVGVKTNKKPRVDRWIRSAQLNFNYPTLNVLITGLFNDLDKPLFWRHEIPSTSLSAGVSIVDQDGLAVSANRYKLVNQANAILDTHDSLTGVVAHSLEPDPIKGQYYILNYKNTSGDIVQEVLNQKPLFTKFPSTASIFTWSQDSTTSLLHYWVVADGPMYTFSIPDDYANIAFREHHTSFLRAELPRSLGPNEPWFPMVSNFNWIKDDETLLRLPEWSLQNFCNTAPTVCAVDDVSEILDRHLIQVSNLGILKTHTGLNTEYIRLLCYKENEKLPGKAITNDKSLDGILVDNKYDVYWEYSALSVIGDLGIVYSAIDVGLYSWCYASYPYDSYYMPIYLKDLNPFRDDSLRGRTVVYYLVPSFVGQERAVEYLVYDEDLMVLSSSQDGSSSNNPGLTAVVGAGLLYDLPEGVKTPVSTVGTLGFTVQVTNLLADDTFIKKYKEGQGYIILGEFSFPETLDESANALITDIRAQEDLNPIDLRLANPERLSLLSDTVSTEILSMPELQGLQEYRCHWALFSDYVDTSLYSKSEIETRLKEMKRAGITAALTFEGVPVLDIMSLDVVASSVVLNWLPVVGFNRKTVVGGVLYKGITSSDISTQVEVFADLAKTSQYTTPFGSDEKLFFKLVPQVVINSKTHKGPESNVIYFSFTR